MLNTSTCGLQNRPSTYIVDGTDAVRGSWPWQAALFFDNWSHCGGSLVSPNWVLTSAECLSYRDGTRRPKSKFTISLGVHNISAANEQDRQSFSVALTIIHRNFDNERLSNNIALMKLNHPATLNSYVNTVCLPDAGQNLTAGSAGFITGNSQFSLLQNCKLLCERTVTVKSWLGTS